jgi:hypothetical protein
MKPFNFSTAAKSATNRRSFLRNAGGATAAVAAIGLAPSSLLAYAPVTTAVDTPAEIFTAALIAEDLATTFYYNVLIGEVIQNVNLAGPGGSATDITASGSASNVGYIRAALSEEISHATLFRTLLGGSSATGDPVQTFYFNPNVFSGLSTFLDQLEILERAFIGAYMAAIMQFALLAAEGKDLTFGSTTYKPSDFAYYAKIASSILGIECEHRALGRAISPIEIPANQLNYEGTYNIETVYNGSNSAVVALTPFLGPSSGAQGYSLQTALANQSKVSLPTSGTIPTE